MCPPLLAILPYAGMAVSAAGSVMGGMMQQSQAKAQAAAYERQAQMARLQGEYQAQRKQEDIDRVTGEQLAGAASAGVSLEGSPSDVLASTASSGALDTAALRWNAGIQADDLNYQARIARMNGRNAMIGGIIGAAGGLLSNLGSLGSNGSTGSSAMSGGGGRPAGNRMPGGRGISLSAVL